MAYHRMDEPVLRADFPQKLRGLNAVLLRVFFKIHVMQKAHQPPEIFFRAVAQLPGEIPHYAFHRQRMLNMKGFLIVFDQKGVCLLPGDLRFHGSSLAFIGLGYCSTIRAKVQTAGPLDAFPKKRYHFCAAQRRLEPFRWAAKKGKPAMKIIPNNLKRMYDLYAPEYEQKALEVLRSGWYILGREVENFEKEFASYMGAKHCVGLANGLDALWMSVHLLDIGPGDEVIVCSNAYIACVMGITKAGATPVFVEPDEYDNLDAEKIEAAITPRTKAIMPVHLYGMSCDMGRVMEIARKHHLRVIEDCAQAHGTHFHGKTLGTFGDVGCFSFYPTKGLGAFGDGGCILTDDEALAEKFRTFRNYGSSVRYHFDVVGANSRLDELQAGLLRVKLTHLDEMNAERNQIAARYLTGITNPCVRLPRIRPDSDSTWHQFVIHTEYRDELAAFLARREIGTVIHYPIPPHLSRAYAYLGYHRGGFPIAERYADEVLSLPMYNGITREEQDFVIDSINAFAPGRD